MEDFIRWSLKYDLWCKMKFFGEDIEAQEADAKLPIKGPQNLLDQLPDIFTREEAGLMRQRLGIRNGSLKLMLSNWKQRGYIELYGDVENGIKWEEVDKEAIWQGYRLAFPGAPLVIP